KPTCGKGSAHAGRSQGQVRRYAAVAHLVERHLAKVEVASSSLVGRSKNGRDPPLHMVAWPSGKAKVCKTFIHQFKSGRHLQDPRAVHGVFPLRIDRIAVYRYNKSRIAPSQKRR